LKLKFLDSFWVRSVFFTMLNRFSLIIFGVVGYMILAKKVFPTTVEMGIWSLFISIIAVFEAVKQGLLRNPMIKFLSDPQYLSQKNKVQTSTLFANAIFSFVIILLILCFGAGFSKSLNSPELYPLILWGTLILLVLIPFNHFEVLLQANFRFKHIFIGYLLRQGVFVCGVIFLLIYFKSSLTLVTLVKLQICSLSLGTIALYMGVRPYLTKGFQIDKVLMFKMFHFGKYIFGTSVFSQLSGYADQFITAKLITPAAVSYYNIVSRITTMIDVPSLAVADVLFPKNVEAMAFEGMGKVRYYFERMVGTIISILLPISLIIFTFPSLIIQIISSSKYIAAVPILQCIVLFSFVRPVAYQFGITMDAIGKPQYNFWVNLNAMVVGLTCIFLGLKYFGYMGAVYGEVVAIIPSNIVIYLVLKKTINISFKSVFRHVWLAYVEVFMVASKFFKRR
jgi:lipopolysaccharide exporter